MTAAATKLGVTSYTMPSDTEIAIIRTFDAPRRILYDAWTKPGAIVRSPFSFRRPWRAS